MTSIGTRSSALAIVPKSSESALTAPTSALQYTAMRPGFAITPAFAKLENDQKRGSIGKAKPILGAEAPTVAHPSHLKGSGTAGTAPDTSDLLKAAFGSETANGTERVTDASSTVSVINVAAGTGADFPRGSGMLIKDGTNGYRIRANHSRSTDAITLGFQLPTGAAPAAGVSLGKCVYYAPANSGHQVCDIWHYLGNGGAVEVVKDARVTELGIEAAAGEVVTMDVSMRGTAYYLNPVEITSAFSYIDFEDDVGNKSVQLERKFYKDPHELAAAAQTLMDAASSNAITVTYDDTTGKWTFASDGTTFKLEWLTGANTANTAATKFGFTVADETGGTSYTSDSAMTYAAPQTGTLDSSDILAAKNNEVLLGDSTDYACFEAESVSVQMSNDVVELKSICAETGVSGTLVSGREVTVSVTALLNKYDVDAFRRFRSNTETRFQFSFGEKSAGSWVAGKCGYLYIPTATITDFKITESDDLAVLELELQAFVDSSGNGEVYLGFL